jgi:hypothetical protein
MGAMAGRDGFPSQEPERDESDGVSSLPLRDVSESVRMGMEDLTAVSAMGDMRAIVADLVVRGAVTVMVLAFRIEK